MTPAAILELIQGAIQRINLARKPESQVSTNPEAPLFGGGSQLDSLGLVSLLIEIEEGLQDRGFDVSLSDARAMSQANSPFRTIPALVDYIHGSMTRPS